MRTTVRLDDEVLKQAKHEATRTGRTLAAVIEDAVRSYLGGRGAAKPMKRFVMTTFRGDPPGVLPGVDLDDSAALLDVDLDHDLPGGSTAPR